MSQTTIPRTPTPEILDNDDLSPLQSPTHPKEVSSNRHFPPAMTPPPSTQTTQANPRFGQSHRLLTRDSSLMSPPPTLQTEPPISAGALYGEVPTMEAIHSMNEEDLRRLATELVPALGEARVTAAHSKLQHSLLSIQTDESIKRAEVEHEATKREVQVLQEGSPAPHPGFSPVASPQASVQRNLHLALSHCGELQQDNAVLRKRLRSSKKLITQLDSENTEFKEQIRFLRQRIKDNRDHLNELQESGAMSINGTPQYENSTPHFRDTPRTPATSRPLRDLGIQSTGSRDAFNALLQVANEETNSVPSTPYQSRQKRYNHHMRGAYSLSSLPITPERRPVTAEDTVRNQSDRTGGHKVIFSAPENQLGYEQPRIQEDRESTISASDHETDFDQDDEPTGSQASQMASNILRRTLEAQKERSSPSKQPTTEGKSTQKKLMGHVQKPRGPPIGNSLKRKAPHDNYDRSIRNSATGKAGSPASERIGLGIGSWPSPAG